MRQKVLLGVCHWLGQRFNLNVTGVRIVFLVAFLAGLFRLRKAGWIVLAIYFILALIKPRDDSNDHYA